MASSNGVREAYGQKTAKPLFSYTSRVFTRTSSARMSSKIERFLAAKNSRAVSSFRRRIGGMMAMSFLIGLPLHFTAGRFTLLNGAVRLAAGLFSLTLGSYIVYEKLSA